LGFDELATPYECSASIAIPLSKIIRGFPMTASTLTKRIRAGKASPYFPFYCADWTIGTRGLTDEAKGFYIDVLILMWDRKSGIPSDLAKLATALGRHLSPVKRLIGVLKEAGKLKALGELLINPRMMDEITKFLTPKTTRLAGRQSQAIPQSSLPFAADEPPPHDSYPDNDPAEVSGIKPKTTTKSMAVAADTDSDLELESSKQKTIIPSTATALPRTRANSRGAARPVLSVDQLALKAKLVAAATPCIADANRTPWLMTVAVAEGWLTSGCDLELDILPTLAAVAAREHASSIVSWQYFSKAVLTAKAVRTSPMAAPAATQARVAAIPQWKADKLRHEANYDAYWAKKAAQAQVTQGVTA
jgi:hypothetical protein